MAGVSVLLCVCMCVVRGLDQAGKAGCPPLGLPADRRFGLAFYLMFELEPLKAPKEDASFSD